MMREKMVEIPDGIFRIWSEGFNPKQRPVREVEVEVDGFAIQAGPVSVTQFSRFFADTGYVTVAERTPDPADYPDADPLLLVVGSVVFHPTAHPVPLNDPGRWWAYVPGTEWRHPWGPDSDNIDRHDQNERDDKQSQDAVATFGVSSYLGL